MASKPERLARSQRAFQVAQAGKVEADLLAGYRQAWQAIKSQIVQVTETIAAAEARGESTEALRFIRLQQLRHLEQYVETEIQFQVNLNAAKITDAQADALLAGNLNAQQLLEASLPAGVQPRPPVAALRNLIGYSTDGKPLGMLLADLGPHAGAQVRKALVTGLATGLNPNKIARNARAALGGNMVRATTIARTEVLRAYRTAAQATYRENDDLIRGWVWYASLGPRTCEVCVSMHGTHHSVDESLDSHANCRCTMVPETKTWAELGFPDIPETRLDVQPGEDWFAGQPVETQRAILGPQKLTAYREGKITLADLVKRTDSERWGKGRTRRSLQDALAVAA